MPEVEFNKIAELKYRKFPVNWLPDEFRAIKKVANDEYFGVVAQYIRRTVKCDLKARGLIGSDAQAELFKEYAPIRVERTRIGVKWANRPAIEEYNGPPRRFTGFMAGLRKNKGVALWFRKRQRQWQESQAQKELFKNP